MFKILQSVVTKWKKNRERLSQKETIIRTQIVWNSKSSIASTAVQKRALQRRRRAVLFENNNKSKSTRKQADRTQTGIHRKDATLRQNQTKQKLMQDPNQKKKKSDEINN